MIGDYKVTPFSMAFLKSPLGHTIVTAVLLIIPWVITHSALDTITVGSVLRGLATWLETKSTQ